jgi:hypothetical protein
LQYRRSLSSSALYPVDSTHRSLVWDRPFYSSKHSPHVMCVSTGFEIEGLVG